MENEIELYYHYDGAGNLTVSVVPDNGNSLYVPASTPPAVRDELVAAFKAEQQALLNG